MAKCPECKKDITYFDFRSSYSYIERGGYDPENGFTYDRDWNNSVDKMDWDKIEFRCPICHKIIFTELDEAEYFLLEYKDEKKIKNTK
jgi:hypothetical protein